MPVALTYPGVYVEEVKSGVRTITATPTSITAFVGRARKGPVNEAVEITSYTDFERVFGGLWAESGLGFAVKDFYVNGGSRAVVVRLTSPNFLDASQREKAEAAAKAIADAAGAATTGKKAKEDAKKAHETIRTGSPAPSVLKVADETLRVVDGLADDAVQKDIERVRALASIRFTREIVVSGESGASKSLVFRARSPGRWAANLRIIVERPYDRDLATAPGSRTGPTPRASAAAAAHALGGDIGVEHLLSVRVTEDAPGGATEVFANLTLADTVRRIDRVLTAESRLVEWGGGDLDGTTLAPNDIVPFPVVNGKTQDAPTRRGDAVVEAQSALNEKKKADPDPSHWSVEQEALRAALDAAQAGLTDGGSLGATDYTEAGPDGRKGLHSLEQLFTIGGLFNLLCIPRLAGEGDLEASVIADAVAYCEKRRAMLIVDPPKSWNAVDAARIRFGADLDNLPRSPNAAVFFPRLMQANPLKEGQVEPFVPCGLVAGVFARTDAQRGVWKSPAGTDASLMGVSSLSVPMTDEENGLLNPLGVNCLRTFPVFGRVVWGSRTLRGADDYADEYKYIPVRRTALFIEESLYRGLKWVVFEPNDEPLWAQIRLNVGAFMHTLFRQGAFQGRTPRDAYLVKCDAETTTEADKNQGVVNIVVGFAPLKPAEFVVIRLQQLAGQVEF